MAGSQMYDFYINNNTNNNYMKLNLMQMGALHAILL